MLALVLPIGEERYAVPTASVREVAAAVRCTPLPAAPPWVLGVVNLRGEVVPLLDTSTMLGLGPMSRRASFAAVVDLEAGPAALASDAVPVVADLDGTLGHSDLPGSLGRHRVGGQLVVLLDPEALVAAARGDGAASGMTDR
jgi:chemotaxis signal transduction protein